MFIVKSLGLRRRDAKGGSLGFRVRVPASSVLSPENRGCCHEGYGPGLGYWFYGVEAT